MERPSRTHRTRPACLAVCPRVPALLVFLSATLLSVAEPAATAAQERLVRRFDAEAGLLPTSVRSLAQDRAGFLWIGTQGGLFRYDGVEMRPWAPQVLDRTVILLSSSPDGGLVALDDAGRLFEITRTGASPVAPLEARGTHGPAGASAAAFAGSGRLWIVWGGALLRRSAAGVWKRMDAGLPGGDVPRVVRANLWGAVDVATSGAVWEVSSSGAAARLATVAGVTDIVAWPDGRRFLITGQRGRVLEVAGAEVREVFAIHGRGIALARRGTTLWASFARHLVAIRADGSVEVLGPEVGIEGGGPLLVDREGALWLGTFTGLFEFPEPDTGMWTERRGLPSSHTRFLARTGDTVWVATWQGTGLLRRGRQGWDATVVRAWSAYGRLYVDPVGSLWTATERGLLRQGRDGREYVDARPRELLGHSLGPDGRLWLATDRGLFVREPGRSAVRRMERLPFGDDAAPTGWGKGRRDRDRGDVGVDGVLADSRGQVWIASVDRICAARAERAAVWAGADWSCQRIPGLKKLTAMIELESGSVWASSGQTGVLRYQEGNWEPVPGSAALPSLSVLGLVRARSGGVWVLGHGAIWRVRERLDGPEGWEVVEELSAWQGVPITEAGGLLEDADGGVWIATTRGVVHVPARARLGPAAPPPVVLMEGRVDGQRVPLDGPLELPGRRDRIEVRFAALSFRDPSLLRYQVRLTPGREWSDVRGQPTFRWVSLRPGTYTAEVRASLDGRTWSAEPARFTFRVRPPWYREPWALALFALAATAALAAIYRARVAYLLGLERQRTRMAMDLHDEIGSGLGSIGILSELVSLDTLKPEERSRLAREISEASEELGAALADIVWSLDLGPGTLEDLAGRLAENGKRLFSDERVVLETDLPDTWPETRPSMPVRRNVLLVGLEAMHNAARHSDARRVLLRLARRGREWELEVRDDGVGVPAAAFEEGDVGYGLASMRRRAEEIGADIRWETTREGGTRVRLRFGLRGGATGGGRLRRWLRRPGRRGPRLA